MPTRQYVIEFTATASQQLRDLRDARARQEITRKIDSLKSDPRSRGKPLVDELKGYYSMRTAKRYRVIYRVEDDAQRGTVRVVCIGIRKAGDKGDAYAVASRMLASGELKSL